MRSWMRDRTAWTTAIGFALTLWGLAAPPFALAQTGGATTISGKMLSTDNRLPPDEVHDIVTEAHFKFRLLGKNNVEESISRAVIAANGHGVSLAGPDFSGNAKLGEAASQISWRVLDAHSLQRISVGNQFILIMNFKIDEARNCQVAAKFLLQKGTAFIVARRFDNGQEGHFTLPRVDSVTCAIE